MSVRCHGNAWIVEQLGEKQDFEAELSRLGYRHEGFALDVAPSTARRGRQRWDPRYSVHVVHAESGLRKTYSGGPSEQWVTDFAEDLARGVFGKPDLRRG